MTCEFDSLLRRAEYYQIKFVCEFTWLKSLWLLFILLSSLTLFMLMLF